MPGTIRRIYVEEEVADHPRTREICARFPRATCIPCAHYGEVFNRRSQDFRLQKRQPALILARKLERLVLPAPPGYGIGGRRNFYFSHSLNCLYDCRYCFLQGMFRSAHYVLFVNYEDFEAALDAELDRAAGEEVHFFSGYDCDSLALEPVTGFAEAFLPYFAERPRAVLELRTKSTQIGALLARPAVGNCVVAFSFTPVETHGELEAGVPAVERRVEAIARLAERGWPIGLRFDPLLWSRDFEDRYRRLFAAVFTAVAPASLHSVTYGGFRLPKGYYERIYRLYPDERLFAAPLAEKDGMVSFPAAREREMMDFCATELGQRLPAELLFAQVP